MVPPSSLCCKHQFSYIRYLNGITSVTFAYRSKIKKQQRYPSFYNFSVATKLNSYIYWRRVYKECLPNFSFCYDCPAVAVQLRMLCAEPERFYEHIARAIININKSEMNQYGRWHQNQNFQSALEARNRFEVQESGKHFIGVH